jgi:urease accessory protein
VQRPFYPEGDACHCYLLHPPGGVVGGDRLEIRVDVGAGAHVLLTTPAAGKFYRSGGRQAQQRVSIRIDGGNAEWMPQETIFYPGAVARQQTIVRMRTGSRFIGWEIACLGLSARAEPFTSGLLQQNFELWLEQRPLLVDVLQLDAAAPTLRARWGLAGNSVVGTFAAYPATRDDVEMLRGLEPGGESLAALTLVDGVLTGRCFGMQADAVKRRFVEWWKCLRPRIMRREAHLPRIWAT